MRTETTQVAIANGASLSAVVDLRAVRVLGIQMPATWTAANLTFQGSVDNVTFADITDDGGTELAVTAAAAKYIVLRSNMLDCFQGFAFVKVRSGTAGVAVAQGAARTISLVTTGRN